MNSIQYEGGPYQEDLFVLHFATRLLSLVSDRETLIKVALETITDFSRGAESALLMLKGRNADLVVEGAYGVGGKTGASKPKLIVPVEGSLFERVFSSKRMEAFSLAPKKAVPMPVESGEQEEAGERCLVFPTIAGKGLVMGAVTIAERPDARLSFEDIQKLGVLVSFLSVSLDNARLFNMAMIDGLTGLYVRRYFDLRLEQELAKLERNPGRVSVLIMDIDLFKNINDTYGHIIGDGVLQELARLMKSLVRSTDVVCRYGGEEFVVLLPDTPEEEALATGERIRKACESLAFPGLTPTLSMTVSGGLATAHEPVSPEELLGDADENLYRAKNSGRNRVVG